MKDLSTANISTLFESTNKKEENLLLNENLLKNIWDVFINKVNLRKWKTYNNMTTLIFISCVSIFAYNCIEIDKNFRGSSQVARLYIGLTGQICHIMFWVLFVWSFWHYDWWEPIIALIASIVVGGFTGIFFQRNLIGVFMSPILAWLFVVLSVIGLLK